MLLSNERVGAVCPGKRSRPALAVPQATGKTIENDEYDKLPGPAFARGFVRNYAKLLGLDVALLNASLDAHLPMPPVNPPAADAALAAAAQAASSRSPAVNPTLIRAHWPCWCCCWRQAGYRLLTQGASAPATPPLAAPAVDQRLAAGRAES